jgi:hypothetical protein
MIEPLAEVLFGRHGNAGPCLLDGWSFPEDGFTWSVGSASRLQLPLPPVPRGTTPILELNLNPFVAPGRTRGQRLAVVVNGVRIGQGMVEGEGLIGYRIPRSALPASAGMLLIELHHPDAARPVDLGFNGDTRRLGFMLHSATVLAAPAEPDFTPQTLPPLDLPDTRDTGALTASVAAHTGQTAHDLMLNFESLGHNCEFGIMQRHCGAEPLGLLRFVGITLPDLLRGLDCGFAGVGDDRWLRVFLTDSARPEFMVCDVRHNISFHSFRFGDETTAEQVRAQQGPQLKFRHDKFMEVLRTGEKLFVFQRPGQLLPAQMLPLLTQLRAHGPNALLFVTESTEHPPGTVAQLGHGFYQGFTRAMAPSEDVGTGDLRAWLSICANAHALWRAQMEPA